MAGLNFFEIVTFIFTVGLIGITILALHTQIKKETKSTSANVLLRTLDRVREDDFKDTTDKILNDRSSDCKDKEIRKLLNYFEYVAIFEEDEVLTFNHIEHMHGAVLRKMKTDEKIQGIIKEYVDMDPNYYFTYLRRLLMKI